MKLGIVLATCRPNSLGALAASLKLQTRPADGVFAVAEGEAAGTLPEGFTRVDYAPPPFYAEEMALNTAADAAVAAGMELLVFLADLTWLDADALECMERYVAETGCPLVAGLNCWHEAAKLALHGTVLPNEKVVQDELGADAGPVATKKHYVFFVFTGVRADVWKAVNGFDERFTGANGYIDTNIARRIEKAFGPCHIHSKLRGHRLNYRTLKLSAPKPKLFTPERNAALDARIAREETAFGHVRAVRFYRGTDTPPPVV